MDHTCSPSVRDDDLSGVKGRPWQFAYREALSPYVFARVLIVIGLYMGAYVAICPLGTTDLPWIQRLAYFTLGSSLVAPLCHSGYAVTLYLVRFRTPGCIAAAVVAQVFVAALTATATAYGVDSLFLSELPAYGFATVYVFMTLSVALCSAVVHYLVSQRVKNEAGGRTAAEPGSPAPSAGDAAAPVARGGVASTTSSKFLHRLPREVGRDIVWLRMNDHYVDVFTTSGQCAVLIRFVDAIAELGDIGGRVHRSHWVAWSHVEGWERRSQRPRLRLTDGRLVPVSRTYLHDVRDALERHRADADPTPRTT